MVVIKEATWVRSTIRPYPPSIFTSPFLYRYCYDLQAGSPTFYKKSSKFCLGFTALNIRGLGQVVSQHMRFLRLDKLFYS
ncbi:43804_t:CDS:2 [Gigaspora margarita]|uniref:43804_t:CDS:1 n=1 Tax=Gigaspora margarita TaxID=4874 RepID=A0ABM8W249_GIGMA|nr:43804_t:CDS:2 [Gigaspora margarita]